MLDQHKQNNLKIWAVFLVFFLPLLASIGIYHYYEYFHFNHINHGTLVQNPIDVSYLYQQTGNGQDNKWHIMYVNHGECGKDCDAITHQLVQLQKALGKDGERVRITLMTPQYPKLKKLQNAFAEQATPDFSLNDKIYLVDPIGNLFMYYSANTDAINVLKDMKKVLEVSQIG